MRSGDSGDPAAAPQLNEFVADASVLQRDSDTRYRLYSRVKMPWPLSDRDVLNQREISQVAATHVVSIVPPIVKQAGSNTVAVCKRSR